MYAGARPGYDCVLRRLVVEPQNSFYGLQESPEDGDTDTDPPIFACRFAETSGYEHMLALANEDGRVALQVNYSLQTAIVCF